MRIYYDKDKIVVRSPRPSDIDAMKNRLRESDVREIWASHHSTPEAALRICVDKTIFAATIENGRPIGIFGLNTTNILGDTATVWMLSTEDLKKIEKRFLRNCKHFVNYMLEFYPKLENFVHADNKVSIAWLKFLGATIDDPAPYGVEGQMFHHFTFTRKNEK